MKYRDDLESLNGLDYVQWLRTRVRPVDAGAAALRRALAWTLVVIAAVAGAAGLALAIAAALRGGS